MEILITGNYDRNYNRTLTLLNGLRQVEGVSVTEIPIDSRKKAKPRLIAAIESADVIYLPPFTHSYVSWVKKLAKGKPVIFDPLISKYMTKVHDYKQVWRFSPRALKNYYKDKIPLSKADIVIADTASHQQYFSDKFKIPKDKMWVLPIGINEEIFYPIEQAEEDDSRPFKVGFYGGFIPLQGTTTIIEVAKLLKSEKDIVFDIIGSGYEYKKVKSKIKKYKLHNVTTPGWIAYKELNARINSFDICLGIFGNTYKSNVVIPNKIYHYCACQKCIISKETRAIREMFTENENILLTDTDPQHIAEKILYIKDNPEERNKIAENSFDLVKNNFTAKHIATLLVDNINTYLKYRS